MGVQERKSRHKANVRRLILDAARDLFVTEGYQHTSLRKIAEKSNTPPPPSISTSRTSPNCSTPC